jgi:2-hydroxy-6-oxo-6-(2'-carboxyphenyl)-hexa-2,4-dienoate hydrolase
VENLTTDGLEQRFLRTVDVAGIHTRIYEAGSGEPLLLIHGGQFGSLYSLDAWSLNLNLLARYFRVVAFDKLGQGHTGAPARPDEYTLDAVVAHVDAVVDSVGLDGFHVAGHSRGGVPALHLALSRPDAVRSLVLIDSGSVAPLDPAVPVGAFYAPLELTDVEGQVARAEVIREPLAQAIDPRWITDDFVDRLTVIAQLPAQRRVRKIFRGIEHDIWRPTLARWRADHLARIDADGIPSPTIVVWGFEDRSAPRHVGIRLHERIAAKSPKAALFLVNGAGHYVFRDRPATFAQALTGFCLEDPQRARR